MGLENHFNSCSSTTVVFLRMLNRSDYSQLLQTVISNLNIERQLTLVHAHPVFHTNLQP